jgi:hypothetical protein
MHIHKGVVMVLLFLCACWNEVLFAKATSPLITYLEGDVKKKDRIEEQWEKAILNGTVNENGAVKTFIRSMTEVTLPELDVIRLAPKTTIQLMKLYHEGKKRIRDTHIAVSEGDIWANIVSLDTGENFTIETPLAMSAIRGTVLRVHIADNKSTTLKVYAGKVEVYKSHKPYEPRVIFEEPREVRGPHPVQGPHEVSLKEWTHIVEAMYQIVISPTGEVTEPFPFSTDEPNENTHWVRWNRTRDRLLQQRNWQ